MVKKNGFNYLFKEIVTELSNADITFANLECPVSFLGTPYYGKPTNVTFRADPSMLFGLKYSGVDIVSLANNHINDYYSKALDETMDLLKIIDIKYSGAGKNIARSKKHHLL
jgi:poly-gamma-glutamate synthesis protein (capsule biosynthesis protein)